MSNSNTKDKKQEDTGPLKAVCRGFLIGLGIASANKVVDAADKQIRGDSSTTNSDHNDIGGFFS